MTPVSICKDCRAVLEVDGECQYCTGDDAPGARQSESLLGELLEQVRRGEVETEPYVGDSVWRSQAAPGQPFPDDSDPEEPPPAPPAQR